MPRSSGRALEHGERELLLEVQLNRIGANRAQVNRGAVKPRELPRYVARVLFAPEDLALVRGEPSGRRRFSTSCSCSAPRASPACSPTTSACCEQRNTLLKSARGARLPRDQLDDPRYLGRATRRPRLRDHRGARRARRRPATATSRRPTSRSPATTTRAELASELSILGAQPDEDDAAVEDAGGCAPRSPPAEAVAAFRSALAQRRRSGARPRADARRAAPRRPPAHAERPAGAGLREPRRILVVRARAQARLGRAAAARVAGRRPGAHPRRRVRRTRPGRGAAASRPRSRGYEQVLITAAVVDDVPDELAAHVVRIEAGRDHRRARSHERAASREHRSPSTAGCGGCFGANSGGRRLERRATPSNGDGARRVERSVRPRPRPAGASATCSTHSPRRLGWDSPLAQSELLAAWAEIAGAETAEHSDPVGIEDGVLTVQCDSTAWATAAAADACRRSSTRSPSSFPEAGIESVRFVGPDAPSWKRGPRAIPGRGPRDTYG